MRAFQKFGGEFVVPGIEMNLQKDRWLENEEQELRKEVVEGVAEVILSEIKIENEAEMKVAVKEEASLEE